MTPPSLTVLTPERAARVARTYNQPEVVLLDEIRYRRAEKMAEMADFAASCDRWDNLYYPTAIHKDAGPDHWPNHISAQTEGMNHISLNVYPVYVDVPASLQAVEPIENILPLDPARPESRMIASEAERTYFSWKDTEEFELTCHQACVVKGLYGRTAVKVYWDEREKRPRVTLVDQPRNLWLGWATANYKRLDWAIYTYQISPNAAIEDYGVDVFYDEFEENGQKIRLPVARMSMNGKSSLTDNKPMTRDWAHDRFYMIECVDYWYRKPKEGATITLGKQTPMETWNAIFVGNVLVKDQKHTEYDGSLPYVPLFNTYVPGVSTGRSEFYDIEQLVREKEERLSEGGQMIRKAVKGQYWQLRGQDAPDQVPHGLKPKEEQVVAPGPGNWIEKIEPFIPAFQLEQYLSRLDRELVDVSGLNDLLRGLASGEVMSSSKAINALVANYEARIRLKRDVFYRWRRDVWGMVTLVWGNKDKDIGKAFAAVGALDVKAPSITPRDDLETATLAGNLVNSRMWSLERGMDLTGVDDPSGEKDLIRDERTDASLFPADVQVQVALAAQLQQLNMTQQQMGGGQDQAAAALQAQAGGAVPEGMPMMNGEAEQGMLPPEGEPLPPGGLAPSGPGENFLAQTAISGGEPNNRLLLQSPVAPEEE